MRDLLNDDDVTTAEELRLIRYQLEEMKAELKSMMTLLVKSRIKPKVRGVPKARHEYEPEFEELWAAYPKRNGTNDKWKAQQQWRARIAQSGVPNLAAGGMLSGVKRYAAWCDATGKTGTELVMQTSRFLGAGQHYLNDWDIPAPEPKKVVIPTEVKALVKFAREHGMESKPGESTWDFRDRVLTAVRGGDV